MHICILLATLVVVVGVLAVTKPSKSKLTVIPLLRVIRMGSATPGSTRSREGMA